MKYWLMKTEPGTYSIDDLLAEPEQTDHWDGVRNYQARNFMRDEMKLGDKVLLYHSGKAPAVVGMTVPTRISHFHNQNRRSGLDRSDALPHAIVVASHCPVVWSASAMGWALSNVHHARGLRAVETAD